MIKPRMNVVKFILTLRQFRLTRVVANMLGWHQLSSRQMNLLAVHNNIVGSYDFQLLPVTWKQEVYDLQMMDYILRSDDFNQTEKSKIISAMSEVVSS